MEVNEVRRLRDLEEENPGSGRGEPALEEAGCGFIAGQDGVGGCSKKDLSPEGRRRAVVLLQETGLSERRFCRLAGQPRSTHRYKSVQSPETELRRKMRELADRHRRFGHPRWHVLLRREGFGANHKKTHRI